MTVFNLVIVAVGGWVLGDMLTLGFLFLNRHKIKGAVRQYIRHRENLAVVEYIESEKNRQSFESDSFEDEDSEYNA